ncbi:hypothetical protein DAPPUDRAFT_318948 [Daphnia pulex]|uniref:Uncharacterized protein n=1 Tax=Daphnia pulex TaxID=6669 RepID=E9GK79_DAPPU|nr:hypothetical protein DAPPUDRAFT_318948 [Daphnia pulex]|eukprot:EFX79943.1 hypothetical protein DAPPUDRAFT_318948 [Daphnia pulex]
MSSDFWNQETEAEKLARQDKLDQLSRQEVVRGRETVDERIDRAISDRFRHQVNVFDKIEQEGRVEYSEFVADYRATENEDETAARREENRLRTDLRQELEEQRKQED